MKNAKNHAILFYNVENLYDVHDDPKVSDAEFTPNGDKKWNIERYHRKLNALSKVILSASKKHPIVAGFSEVENRSVVEDLILKTDLVNFNYTVIHQDSPDNRGIDVCLIYDKDFVKRITHEFLRVDFHWNQDIKTRDILFFRCQINNETFLIVVNHWPSRRAGADETEDKRLHVATAVKNKLKTHQTNFPNDKILVMGDFNDEPQDKSIDRILKSKRHKNIKQDEFYNLMTEADKNEKGTSSHMGEWLMIDQMMINRNFLQNNNDGLGVKNQKAKIYSGNDVLYCRANGNCQPNQTYGGDYYLGGISDHLPVLIELE